MSMRSSPLRLRITLGSNPVKSRVLGQIGHKDCRGDPDLRRAEEAFVEVAMPFAERRRLESNT